MKTRAYIKSRGGERGFAMLFAVLVSSVLLSVGLSIFNLTVKELTLSSSGRESQFAFYAADTGAECAIYWDFKANPVFTMFATSTGSQTGNWRNAPIDANNPTCVSVSLSNSFKNPISVTSNSAQTQFSINIPAASPEFCSIVTVTKSSATGVMVTTIDSRGYNTPCSSTDPGRIERGLRVSY